MRRKRSRGRHLSGRGSAKDLASTTEEDEQAGIEAGEIRAMRVDYTGTLR